MEKVEGGVITVWGDPRGIRVVGASSSDVGLLLGIAVVFVAASAPLIVPPSLDGRPARHPSER